jgi:hypothetical protein
VLQAQLADAEAKAATEIKEAFSNEARVENAINGVTDRAGIALGQPDDPQIPSRDFVGAIQDDLALGIREESGADVPLADP